MNKRFLAAGAAVAIAFLSGCSAYPGAAAVVNGTTVTEKDLDAFIKDAGLPVGSTRQQALSALIQLNGVAAPIVKAHSKELDKAERKEAYSSCQISADVNESSSKAIRTWCEFNYLAQKNEGVAKEFEEALEKATIVPSPRYAQDGDASGQVSLPSFLTGGERES